MNDSRCVTIGLSDDQRRIIISGDVDSLRNDRRVRMSLKRIDPSFDGKDMSIAVGDRNVTELLLALHEALAARGYVDPTMKNLDPCLTTSSFRSGRLASLARKHEESEITIVTQKISGHFQNPFRPFCQAGSCIPSSYYPLTTWPSRKTQRISPCPERERLPSCTGRSLT